MTDRELLALAAKAAGLEVVTPMMIEWDAWNPLDDDGDALRLAVKLELLVHIETCYYAHAMKDNVHVTEHIGNDGRGCIYAATRRAIVRAAAEIGKEMK